MPSKRQRQVVDDPALLRRALSAYWKAGGDHAPIPSNASGPEHCGDLLYVVLRNGSGILAVYRVRNDGILKRLRRWPSDLGEAAWS